MKTPFVLLCSKMFLWCLALVFMLSCRTTITIDYPELIENIQEDTLLVIRNVDVFTGEGDELLRGYDVFIDGERIAKIQPSSSLETGNYKVIDGTGKTLLPGFIDTHVHVMSGGSSPWAKIGPSPVHNLHAWLFSGITTIYDLGGAAEITKPLQEGVRDNTIYGPDIYFTAAPVTVKGSHPIPALKELNPWPARSFITSNLNIIKKPADAKKIIEGLVEQNVDYIKLICDELPPGSPFMAEELMKPLIEEAHNQGLKVLVHIGSVENALAAARAGADVLAHAVYRDKLSDADVKFLKEKGVKMIFTISGFENIDAMYTQKYKPKPFDTLTTPEPILGPVTGDNAAKMKEAPVMFGLAKAIHHYIGDYEQNFDLLQKYKIPFLVGTDSPNYGAYPGSSLHQEMQTLVKYGYTKAEVLRAATSDAARMFLDKPDFGTIKEGNLANVVLLDANPLEDIENTQKINLVIKRGQVVDRTFEK
ncbi:amidohydrolase family protein [Owenweeksia hongkongensis]|uniref:amidohydrolase family protein n=1 Tax=Owenweeksia hongkongensis TaxID=253245 RepID=UPI003A8F859C